MTRPPTGLRTSDAVLAACIGLLAACASPRGAPTGGGGGRVDAGDDAPYGVIYADAGGTSGDASDDSDAGTVGVSAFVPLGDVTFGFVPCGSAPVTQTFPIGNEGTDPLTASAMTTGTAFSVTPNSLTIPPNSTGSFNITATVPGSATAGAPLLGSLEIATNDPSVASASVRMSVTPSGGTLALMSASGAVSFPTTEVGETATPQSLTLINTGNAGVSVTLTDPSNPLFALDGVPDGGVVSLDPGATWPGSVVFTPTDTSVATATSTVKVTGTTCGTSLASISFSGQGGYGQITGWPTAPVDFGPADCGGAAPPSQSIRLVNNSTVDVLVTSVSITPPDSGFTTDAAVGSKIAAQGGYRFNVQAPPVASPSALTPVSATLTIQTDAERSPHAVILQEEPRGAVLVFDTSATPNFGSFGQVVLLTSATQTFAVKNTGTAPADVVLGTNTTAAAGGALDDAAADAGVDATVTPAAPFNIGTTSFSLAPNATQTDAVTFVPATGAVYTVAIALTATGAVCGVLPEPLPLSGVGFGGGPSVVPSALAFAPTCGAPGPPSQIVTVTNSGPANMSWSLGPLTGPGAAQYKLNPHQAPGLLSPGAHADIEVSVAAIPSPAPNPDPSVLAAEFAITTDVPRDNPHVVTLTDTPIGDILSLSVQSLRFGQYPIDHRTPQQTFTVTNSANAGSPAAYVSLTLSTPGGAVYVEPVDGGAVCIVGEAGDEGGAFCVPAPNDGADAGDDAEGGDAGDSSDGEAGPEYVVGGYLFGPGTVANLAPGGGVSPPQSVTFIPTAATSYPGTISLLTGDALCSALPGPVQLSGTGTQGQVSVAATILAFGTDPADPLGLVNCGATGLTRTFEVVNAGNQIFNVTGLSLGLGANSAYTVSVPGAAPAPVPIGGSVTVTVTPNAVPANVADPNDPTPFSDTLTVTTDAVFDSPHNVSLVMQARGAVIADRPLATNWNFGTINLGSIGTFAASVNNTGNAPAAVALQGLSYPAVFGLQNNPTTAAANKATAFIAQFVPAAADQSYTDQGTLVVTTPQVFCQPLPAAWAGPAITLTGSTSSNPPIRVTGSLAFPSSECGSAAPGAQTVTLTNYTNQTYAFTASFSTGTFYTLSSPGQGSIPANGTATITVAPKTVAPAQGVQPGSAPYADSLVVATMPAVAGDSGAGSGSSPAAPTFSIPISWTLNGAVLSLPEGAGPKTDGAGNAFYPSDTVTGYALPMDNHGNEATTVSFAIQPSGVFAFSPAAPFAIAAGARASPQLVAGGSDATCSATTPATATFFYSGSICQPFGLASVAVNACVGAQ